MTCQYAETEEEDP